jgi:hypothetical protein
VIFRLAAYIWASPNSVLGLAIGTLLLLFGAKAAIHQGIVEISGGLVGSLLVSPRLRCPYRAITLGHVVLATNETTLDACRRHERVHVRQYEIWGPFFLPAYISSSLWQLLCGRSGYRDNYFERQAFASQRPG